MAYFRCEKSTKIIKNLLWTNSSPTTAFNPQTLSLDLSKYDGIVIYQKNLTTVTPNLDNTSQNYIPKDGITRYIASPYAGNDLRRQVTVTNTGITFGNGINGASTTQNTVTIPLEIYGYVYELDMGNVDKRKFILKDGIFQGTRGTDYGVLGTLTQNTGYVTISSGSYTTGIAPFISASDRTKYKRVVFDADNANAGAFRMYSSTTESGSRTAVNTSVFAMNLSSLSDNIFLYMMPNGNTMNYYNIYLE